MFNISKNFLNLNSNKNKFLRLLIINLKFNNFNKILNSIFNLKIYNIYSNFSLRFNISNLKFYMLNRLLNINNLYINKIYNSFNINNHSFKNS